MLGQRELGVHRRRRGRRRRRRRRLGRREPREHKQRALLHLVGVDARRELRLCILAPHRARRMQANRQQLSRTRTARASLLAPRWAWGGRHGGAMAVRPGTSATAPGLITAWRASAQARHREAMDAAQPVAFTDNCATIQRFARRPPKRRARAARRAASGRGRDHGAGLLLPLAARGRPRPAGLGVAAAPSPTRSLLSAAPGGLRVQVVTDDDLKAMRLQVMAEAATALQRRRVHLAELLRVGDSRVAREALGVGALAKVGSVLERERREEAVRQHYLFVWHVLSLAPFRHRAAP